MKFVADECCEKSLIESLRENGHDVLSIAESKPGIKDENVLKESYEENRILLTEDKDFGEIVFRLKKPARGIILLRFAVKERHLKWLSVPKTHLFRNCKKIIKLKVLPQSAKRNR